MQTPAQEPDLQATDCARCGELMLHFPEVLGSYPLAELLQLRCGECGSVSGQEVWRDRPAQLYPRRLQQPLNRATAEQMVATLARRTTPTVAFIDYSGSALRGELEELLHQQLSEYEHISLDVGALPVVSVLAMLRHQLPPQVQRSVPVAYVVSVHGLETSLVELDTDQEPAAPCALAASGPVAPADLERALQMHQVPYIILIWGGPEFFCALEQNALDFCRWVVHSFRFG
jgi:hypothetical protein